MGSPKRSRVRKTRVVLLVGRAELAAAQRLIREKISAVLTSIDFLLHVILRVRINLHRQHCSRGGEVVHALRVGFSHAVKGGGAR